MKEPFTLLSVLSKLCGAFRARDQSQPSFIQTLRNVAQQSFIMHLSLSLCLRLRLHLSVSLRLKPWTTDAPRSPPPAGCTSSGSPNRSCRPTRLLCSSRSRPLSSPSWRATPWPTWWAWWPPRPQTCPCGLKSQVRPPRDLCFYGRSRNAFYTLTFFQCETSKCLKSHQHAKKANFLSLSRISCRFLCIWLRMYVVNQLKHA